jgi:hypothetical protein
MLDFLMYFFSCKCNSCYIQRKITVALLLLPSNIILLDDLLFYKIMFQLDRLSIHVDDVTWSRVTITNDSSVCVRQRLNSNGKTKEQVINMTPLNRVS